MKNNVRLLVSFLLMTMSMVAFATDSQDLTRLKKNYQSLLIAGEPNDSLKHDLMKVEPEVEVSDQVVVELHQKYPTTEEKLSRIRSHFKADGSWDDVNYADKKRSGWEPKVHADRLLELAKLFADPSSKYYQSKEIEAMIRRAMNYWFTTKPVCLNWWYNQIGIPRTMGSAFVLFDDYLTAEERQAAVEVMQRAKFGMTGQNKVWLAGNVLMRAILQRDEQLVRQARDVIASEIVTGQTEGIKNDWSFHQHGPQLQFGNYGLSFISGMAFYYGVFKGTPFQFSDGQIDILTSLINKGYKWVIWNRRMDVSSLGRQFFHNTQLHKAYSLAFASEAFGIGGFPRVGNPLVGQKHFDDSDYTVHRSKDWMASIKMSSSRVKGSELVNEDNLKGKFMGDGATFFYQTGDEYRNIFPYWYWDRIPGVTSYENPYYKPMSPGLNRDVLTSKVKHPQQLTTEQLAEAKAQLASMNWSNNTSAKVGGLTDGKIGMSAMEIVRDGLTAYKAWLMTDDYVLCLGNGIRSDSTALVYTGVEQCLQRGDLEMWQKNAWTPVTEEVTVEQQEVRFFHNHTAYIIMGQNPCVAMAEERSARWCDVMGMYTPEVQTNKVVDIHLLHGTQPCGASYLYIVVPQTTKEALRKMSFKDVKVVRNDEVAQIVMAKAAGKGCWIAAYEATTLKVWGKAYEVKTPGIYYVEKDGKNLKTLLEKPFRL